MALCTNNREASRTFANRLSRTRTRRQAGYADGWSQEQLAACEKLAARCQDLENSLRFCTEQASLLKEDAEQALGSGGASSTTGALVAAALRASDPELWLGWDMAGRGWRAALSEALRRMANFDHDLEKQRAALKRRRKKEPGAMADDATLTALVVERGQAVAQCQDFAQKMPAQAWNLVLSMWQGKLTDGLERLAMRPGGDDETEDLSENEAARQRRRLLAGSIQKRPSIIRHQLQCWRASGSATVQHGQRQISRNSQTQARFG
ncbi:unnamed protein product [Symbiodinium natans]|uniref:Uncharacterized protein n=1 Tax=Symbiodinium natans TaxID=878477 RepID=A0A812PD12_9DINO|nr:unnamed protein product [Symbiodinium natans]